MSSKSDSRCSFRAPSGANASFFQTKRNKVLKDPKMKKGDVPMLVLPTLAEKERMSRTPRGDKITLPTLPQSARQSGQLSQRGHSFGGAATDRSYHQSKKPVPPPAPPVHLPQLTFRTNYSDGARSSAASTPRLHHSQPRSSRPAPVTVNTSAGFLSDYDGGENPVEAEDLTPDRQIAEFEASGPKNAGESSYHTVNTIDEEASARVLKVMFQLGLTKNSAVIAKLRELEPDDLQRRVLQEVGHKKQMSREEFHSVLQKVLKNEYIHKRDSNTLFSVFDDDKSGLVDAVEFVGGFTSLVTSGINDVAFKFLAMLMEGREKSTMNAFLSRFELSILIEAAQSYYSTDPEIVHILEELPNKFNFSHHMGRIPVVNFRNAIHENEDLRIIFENLPNPSKQLREMPSLNASIMALRTQGQPDWMTTDLVADQYMNQNTNVQHEATENDSPKWWSMGGIVYRSSDKNPYPEPVFMKDGSSKN